MLEIYWFNLYLPRVIIVCRTLLVTLPPRLCSSSPSVVIDFNNSIRSAAAVRLHEGEVGAAQRRTPFVYGVALLVFPTFFRGIGILMVRISKTGRVWFAAGI